MKHARKSKQNFIYIPSSVQTNQNNTYFINIFFFREAEREKLAGLQAKLDLVLSNAKKVEGEAEDLAGKLEKVEAEKASLKKDCSRLLKKTESFNKDIEKFRSEAEKVILIYLWWHLIISGDFSVALRGGFRLCSSFS